VLWILRETPWNACSLLPETRHSAKRFFAKALAAPHISTPRVITVDKNEAYLKAFNSLKAEGIMPDACELRQSKYLNNLVEQDHRLIKRLVKLGMGFFSFETAWRTDAADMKP
jgi:transposase-like protein